MKSRGILATYLDSIRDLPLMDRAEEREMVELLNGPNPIARRMARQRITESHLRFAIRCAVRFAKRHGLSYIDCVQAANLGLLKGIDHYDPTKGTCVLTYAAYWIYAELGRLTADAKMIHVPVYLTVSDAAKRYSEDRLQSATRAQSIVSLEEIFAIEGTDAPMFAEEPDEEGRAWSDSQRADILRWIAEIPVPRSREILMRCFGIDRDPQQPIEIARHFGISRQRVRQIIQTQAVRLADRASLAWGIDPLPETFRISRQLGLTPGRMDDFRR